MERSKKCRIKVTLQCDRACPFCINKDADYRRQWKSIDSIKEIALNVYRSIIVSGGEPTLLGYDSLVALLRAIWCGREYSGAPIYLQTNGSQLSKRLVQALDPYIDGIGLSLYEPPDHLYTRWLDILRVKPVRFYIQDELAQYLDVARFERDGFGVRIWTVGEFSVEEDIYVFRTTPKILSNEEKSDF